MNEINWLPKSEIQDFIFITVPVQYEKLSKIAMKEGLGVPEFIARAVDFYIQQTHPDAQGDRK